MDNIYEKKYRKSMVYKKLFQIKTMPYASFVGFTKGEIEDLEMVVEHHGDVDYSGEKSIFVN